MLLWGKLFLFASRLKEIGKEEERNMRKAMCPYRMQSLQQFRENKLLTTLNQSLFFLSFFSSFFLFKVMDKLLAKRSPGPKAASEQMNV